MTMVEGLEGSDLHPLFGGDAHMLVPLDVGLRACMTRSGS